jgi:hypothetical protein
MTVTMPDRDTVLDTAIATIRPFSFEASPAEYDWRKSEEVRASFRSLRLQGR